MSVCLLCVRYVVRSLWGYLGLFVVYSYCF